MTEPLDLDRLRTIYEQWPTDRLLRAVTDEAPQYHPEAIPVMLRELDARGIPRAQVSEAAVEEGVVSRQAAKEKRLDSIRGLLLVLIGWVGLESTTFIFGIAQPVTDWRVPLVTVPTFAAGCYGIYCVRLLIARRRWAPWHTRRWVVLGAALALATFLLDAFTNGAIPPPVAPLITTPAALLYLALSKRVARVYGESLPGLSPAANATATTAPAVAPAGAPPSKERIHAVLSQLIDVRPSRRADWVLREFPDDAALRARVLASLPSEPENESDEDEESAPPPPAVAPPIRIEFSLPVPSDTSPPKELDPGNLTGQRLGPWRVDERVAEQGAMSEVYLGARADGAYRKAVAIKVIPFNKDSHLFLQRFARERHLLGQLDHANIVRVVDAGMTPDGRPYLVMEWIDGHRLDTYIVRENPNLAERLNLFLAICSAVQHAHQNFIVHRDLKPANIMVTGEGVPKVLDFGLATLLANDQVELGSLFQSKTGEAGFTPPYASPEQIQSRAVTTATDVYALGMVLYELLTGRYPYKLTDKSTPWEVSRAVCHDLPVPPSQAIRSGASVPAAGEIPGVGDGALRGDLESIVLQALRKEPGERYQTVKEFAEDVSRVLRGDPVRARGDAVYRARVLLKRYAVPAAAAVTIIGALVAALTVVARKNAETQAALDSVNDALANSLVMQSADSSLSPVRALELAERALATSPESHAARTRVNILLTENEPLARDVQELRLATFDRSGTHVLVGAATRVRVLDDRLQDQVMVDLGEPVSAVAMSQDGALLAAGSHRGRVTVWDVGKTTRPRFTASYGAGVTGLAFGAGGGLVVGGGSGVEHWSPQGERVRRIDVPGDVTAVSATSSRALVDTGRTVTLVDTASGAAVSEWPIEMIGTARFTADGASVTVIDRASIFDVDATTGRRRTPLANAIAGGDPRAYWNVEDLSDAEVAGGLVVSVASDGVVRFRSRSGDPLRALLQTREQRVSLDPSGKRVLVWGGSSLKVWPIAIGPIPSGPLDSFVRHRTDGASFPRGDGKWLTLRAPRSAAGDDGMSWVELTGENGALVLRRDDPRKEVVRLPFAADPNRVMGWALAANGVAVAADSGPSLRDLRTTVWTQARGAEGRYSSVEVPGQLLALTLDGATLAVWAQGVVSLHDTRTGLLLRRLDPGGGNVLSAGPQVSAQFTDDGSELWMRRSSGTVGFVTGDAGFERKELSSSSLLARARSLLPKPAPPGAKPQAAREAAGAPAADDTAAGAERHFEWREVELARRCIGGCCHAGPAQQPVHTRMGDASLRYAFSEQCWGQLQLAWPGRLYAADIGVIRDQRALDADGDGVDELVLLESSTSNGRAITTAWATVWTPKPTTSDVPPETWSDMGSFSDSDDGKPGWVVFRDLDGDGRRELSCSVSVHRDEHGTRQFLESAMQKNGGDWKTVDSERCRRPDRGPLLVIGVGDREVTVASRFVPAGDPSFAWSSMVIER